jgi:hypothetical protein
VASLSMQPSPDFESARYHLEHAKEMIEAMMKIDNSTEGNVSDGYVVIEIMMMVVMMIMMMMMILMAIVIVVMVMMMMMMSTGC